MRRARLLGSLLVLTTTLGCDGTLGVDAEEGIDEAAGAGRRAAASLQAQETARVCETGGLGLRQRTGPGLGYGILRVMPEGAATTILEGAGGWYRNRWNGLTGWSFGDFLCPAAAANEPAPAPNEPAPAPAPPAPSSGKVSLQTIVGGPYTLSQGYGPSSFYGGYGYCHSYGHWPTGQNVHCAVDVAIARGTPLYAGAGAKVIAAGGTPWFKDDLNPGAGELRLRLADGTEVIYGHTASVEVALGATVAAGQRIGTSGSAGTGAHLHLEVRVPGNCTLGLCTVDPVSFFGP